jgi:hypothetical protein
MGSEVAYFPDALARTVDACDGPTSPSESPPEPSPDALDEPAADRLSGISRRKPETNRQTAVAGVSTNSLQSSLIS